MDIAEALLEHCLWYFVRGSATPDIVVKDDTESISLCEIFDRCMHSEANVEKVSLKGYAFEFTYACYVTSAYLDEHVRPERTEFNIAENVEGRTSDFEVSLSEIGNPWLRELKSI